MINEHFNLGYEDKLNDRSFHSDYNKWSINEQRQYELGRLYWTIGRRITKHTRPIDIIRFIADEAKNRL